MEKVWHNRKGLCSGIEVVITALTRNQVYPQGYRGFESHPLRQLRNSPYRCASRPEGAESSAGRGIPSRSPAIRVFSYGEYAAALRLRRSWIFLRFTFDMFDRQINRSMVKLLDNLVWVLYNNFIYRLV